MNVRKLLATTALAGTLSITGLAVETGVAGAQPKANQQTALCKQVEARLHVLLGQYLRTKDLKRLHHIAEESQRLQDYYATYCADATEPVK